MIWDSDAPDEQNVIVEVSGCSNAVAREAAPSSAISVHNIDIVQRMAKTPVNLVKVTSAVGRGLNR